nr:hypothetical protein CFP56_31735 [Quercus suber]
MRKEQRRSGHTMGLSSSIAGKSVSCGGGNRNPRDVLLTRTPSTLEGPFISPSSTTQLRGLARSAPPSRPAPRPSMPSALKSALSTDTANALAFALSSVGEERCRLSCALSRRQVGVRERELLGINSLVPLSLDFLFPPGHNILHQSSAVTSLVKKGVIQFCQFTFSPPRTPRQLHELPQSAQLPLLQLGHDLKSLVSKGARQTGHYQEPRTKVNHSQIRRFLDRRGRIHALQSTLLGIEQISYGPTDKGPTVQGLGSASACEMTGEPERLRTGICVGVVGQVTDLLDYPGSIRSGMSSHALRLA